MTPSEIQKRLKDNNTNQHAIAAELSVSNMSVSDVINHKRISDRIMKAVAAAIREDHRFVFPDYYLRPPKRKTSKVQAAA